MKPNLAKHRLNLSLLDINIGSIISDANPALQTKNKFIVVGISLTDYAVIRLYEEVVEINTPLSNYFIPVEPVYVRPQENKTFSADCSKLLIRKFGTIGTWLKKHPDSFYGHLNEQDLAKIAETVKTAQTIPRNIKNQFDL